MDESRGCTRVTLRDAIGTITIPEPLRAIKQLLDLEPIEDYSMPVSVLQVVGIGLSAAVLCVTLWNLYLSHYKEDRSSVELLPQENNPTSGLGGGNHALDEDARWTGHFYLKIANTGEKGAYIASLEHNLKGFLSNGGLTEAAGADLEVNEHRTSWVGKEIDPNSSSRYRVSMALSPAEDIGVLVENDSAVIEHEMIVEDNQGSYTVKHETAIGLSGPNQAVEEWRDVQGS